MKWLKKSTASWALITLLLPNSGLAQYEFYNSIVLHAIVGHVTTCTEAEEISCICYPPYAFPSPVVPPNTEVTIFVIVTNVIDCEIQLMGLQTAFEWDPSWKLLGSVWDCQKDQLVATTPQDPGGPRSGTIATVFDCPAPSRSLVIGRLLFRTGATGCLRQVESEYPFGTHVLDCTSGTHYFDPDDYFRWGAVCTYSHTSNGCWDPGAVEETTWGRIKAHYGSE